MADNSSRRFKFISPGVFVEEIDNSQLPALPTSVGPVVIGRALKGPANVPVTIDSYSDFVQTFGNPVPGGQNGDVWRDGDMSAPTYAPFAAKAWLTNNGPVTFLRLTGDQSDQADASLGLAGWKVGTASTDDNGGGVYGLVVWPSSSISTAGPSVVTGALAAQFYLDSGRLLLSGTVANSASSTLSNRNGCTLMEIPDLDSFKLQITGSSPSVDSTVTVSLNPESENFVRKVLNTNPTITNSAITTQATRDYYQGGIYFVGESYERSLTAQGTTSIGVLSAGITSGKLHAALFPMAMDSGSYASQQNDFNGPGIRASTGWFISQDLSNNNSSYYPSSQQRLFRLEALTAGDAAQRDIKISISNIKAPEGNYQSYGSFSVLIRRIGDSDNIPQVIERFDNLNLNPASPDYIARRIGDRYERYDQTNLRNVDYGQYANQSNYIRVVMDEDVDAGAGESRWLPFGCWGPPKYRDVSIVKGSDGWSANIATPASASKSAVNTMLAGNSTASFGLGGHLDAATNVLQVSGSGFSGSVIFPSVPLRQLSTWGQPRSLKSCYWGAWSGRDYDETFFNSSIHDMLRPRSFDVQNTGESANPAATSYDIQGQTTASADTQSVVTSWVFSLDDVSGSSAAGYTYAAGQRRAGTSLTAPGAASYKTALSAGIDRFTTFLHGGFNGFDITEREPFRNSKMTQTDEKKSYELFTLRKAINIISDPDYVQMNSVTIPGVWKAPVTNYLLDTAEERGDCLAIIDVEQAYTPDTETNVSQYDANAGNTPANASATFAARSINNSYGATYYPWVRILDTNTNQSLWAPPSVAALGVLSTTDRLQAPWFAPAGFTRGGLSEGAAGLPVLDVSQRLTSDERDELYEVNINPIAKFPAEGIVIFGQKTLQQTASALDRINVRRLMIFLKREISFIASRLIFGPNTQDTWDRFLGQATPLLDSVKAEYGIEDFRLILDSSTTTPDLVDRNIIYAKLLVKPTRSVEFFAIDFVVTNSGAAFED